MFPIESLVLLNYPGPPGPGRPMWMPPGPIIEKPQQGEPWGLGGSGGPECEASVGGGGCRLEGGGLEQHSGFVFQAHFQNARKWRRRPLTRVNPPPGLLSELLRNSAGCPEQ